MMLTMCKIIFSDHNFLFPDYSDKRKIKKLNKIEKFKTKKLSNKRKILIFLIGISDYIKV